MNWQRIESMPNAIRLGDDRHKFLLWSKKEGFYFGYFDSWSREKEWRTDTPIGDYAAHPTHWCLLMEPTA